MFEILNQDCIEYMNDVNNGSKHSVIITSPPYNMTSRKGGYGDTGRYDVYEDWKSTDEYLDWTKNIFKGFEKVLTNRGVVCYNFSYSIEDPSLPYKLVAKVESDTNFRLVDTIIWKKKAGLPFPANNRRLSRNWEFVWIFVRKDEIDTFNTNRKVVSISDKTGQKYYNADYNFIETVNNNGKTSELNQATYSEELVDNLLNLYGVECGSVFDPFNGTGTTGVSAIRNGLDYTGCEISKAQCKYSEERLNRASGAKLGTYTTINLF